MRAASGERILMHKICAINGRHRWMTLQGEDVIERIEAWREDEAGADEI